MKADYAKFKDAIERTTKELRSGQKNPNRARRVDLAVIENFETEISNGEYSFRIDAALDAGGNGKFARPMDQVLGGLLSCVEMWCLRWAALGGHTIDDLKLTAVGRFNWRGEYLEEVDSGLTAIDLTYRISDSLLKLDELQKMAEMVARRCPVFATLRKATIINEEIHLNSSPAEARQWLPGVAAPIYKI